MKYLWIEPSAGKGAFIKPLLETSSAYLAFDIEPKQSNIKEQDFLKLSRKELISLAGIYARYPMISIGNPPFGKNSSMAIRFFNHAAVFSSFIAMIFPATFEKSSIQKRLNPHMHLIASFRLSSDLFDFDGKLVPVPTVFQIWEKKEVIRVHEEKATTSLHFEFVKKDQASFAIQRVGVAAGRVKHELEKLPISSHYFIKAPVQDLPAVLKTFEMIDWSGVKYNTAGNPSIAKREVIELFEASYLS